MDLHILDDGEEGAPREKRRKAMEARLKQVEFYQEWALAAEENGARSNRNGEELTALNTRKCGVTFATKDKLRDAVTRSDISEGKS